LQQGRASVGQSESLKGMYHPDDTLEARLTRLEAAVRQTPEYWQARRSAEVFAQVCLCEPMCACAWDLPHISVYWTFILFHLLSSHIVLLHHQTETKLDSTLDLEAAIMQRLTQTGFLAQLQDVIYELDAVARRQSPAANHLAPLRPHTKMSLPVCISASQPPATAVATAHAPATAAATAAAAAAAIPVAGARRPPQTKLAAAAGLYACGEQNTEWPARACTLPFSVMTPPTDCDHHEMFCDCYLLVPPFPPLPSPPLQLHREAMGLRGRDDIPESLLMGPIDEPLEAVDGTRDSWHDVLTHQRRPLCTRQRSGVVLQQL
jgi:hypothetical protein